MKTIRRRRKEFKTDYKKRMNLLKSEKPRVVCRITNRYIIAQYVESYEAQDKIILTVNSKDLLKHGWPENAKGSLKSIQASYLTGYLIGKQIKNKKLENPIADFGMQRMIYNTRVFGFIKGLIDAGLEVQCKEEALPAEDKINGEHQKNKIKVEEIKSKIDKE